MMYSTGMPILYLFAFIFFGGFFWVYKFLLLKYYMRTTRFNEELPVKATFYAKFAILLHVIIGGFMITNSTILPPASDDPTK